MIIIGTAMSIVGFVHHHSTTRVPPLLLSLLTASWKPILENLRSLVRPLHCRQFLQIIDICFSFGLHGAHKFEETRLGDLGQFFAICPPLLHSCSPPLHIEKIIDKF